MVKSFFRQLKLLFSSLFGQRRVIALGIYGEPNTGKTTLANKISVDWLGKPVGRVSDMPHETRTIQKAEHIEVKTSTKKLTMNLLDMPGLATHIDYKKFLKYYKPANSPDSAKLNDLKISDLKKIAKKLEIETNGGKQKIVKTLKPQISKGELQRLIRDLGIKVGSREKSRKYTPSEAKEIAQEATKGVVDAIKYLDNVDVVLAMMDATRDPLSQVNIMLIGNLEAKGIPVVIVANKTDLKNAKPEAISNAFPQHVVVPVSALQGTNLDELYSTIAEKAL